MSTRVLSDQDLIALRNHLSADPQVPIVVSLDGIHETIAMADELLELRAMRRAFMQPTGDVENIFPPSNKLVGAIFTAYCLTRSMNPADWPTIGVEKQNAWIAAANAAHREIFDPRLNELMERIVQQRGPIAQALSASEWHELQEEISGVE